VKVAKIITRTDKPKTKNKVGRVFLMVILSEFQQIYSNKNSQFSQKKQIAIRNFRKIVKLRVSQCRK